MGLNRREDSIIIGLTSHVRALLVRRHVQAVIGRPCLATIGCAVVVEWDGR